MTRSTHKVFQICSIIALVKRMSTNLMMCWMLSEWIEYTGCVESLTQFSKCCLNILDSKPTYFAFMPGLYLVKSISRKRRRKGQDGRDADDGTGNCMSGPNLRKCIFGVQILCTGSYCHAHTILLLIKNNVKEWVWSKAICHKRSDKSSGLAMLLLKEVLSQLTILEFRRCRSWLGRPACFSF